MWGRCSSRAAYIRWIICHRTLFGRIWRSYRAGYFKSGRGHVRNDGSKGRHFFSSSPRQFARVRPHMISDAMTRQRARDRSLFTAVRNVTVHKSMVTWLNTAWIYRARLSPCVMINYDDRMTAGLATRGWRCARVCTGWRVIWGAASFSEGCIERRALLLYAPRLPASRRYGLSI